MYKRGLIIGKFMPLHIGHENMFNYAMNLCDELFIVVLGHDGEPIPLSQRYKWVKDCDEFKDGLDRVNIISLHYDPNKLNPSSESDLESAHQWADFLENQISCCDVIIGSEEYVKFMAEYKGKHYEIYDEKRNNISISATEIRNNPVEKWGYLASSVKRDIGIHICICGTESSGKTTLSRHLEDKYSAVTIIPEIGRCLISNAETCNYFNLKTVFNIHKQLLDEVKDNPTTPIMIWDTDNITTLSYINYLFGIKEKQAVPIADNYIFLSRDFDYANDSSRLSEDNADELRKSHIMWYCAEYGDSIKNFHMIQSNKETKAYLEAIVNSYLAYVRNIFK